MESAVIFRPVIPHTHNGINLAVNNWAWEGLGQTLKGIFDPVILVIKLAIKSKSVGADGSTRVKPHNLLLESIVWQLIKATKALLLLCSLTFFCCCKLIKHNATWTVAEPVLSLCLLGMSDNREVWMVSELYGDTKTWCGYSDTKPGYGLWRCIVLVKWNNNTTWHFSSIDFKTLFKGR